MDQRSLVESLFDTGCRPHVESPRTLQSQFSNEFVSLNDLLIPENIHIHGYGSHNLIDLDDINVLEAEYADEDAELNIPMRGESKREKIKQNIGITLSWFQQKKSSMASQNLRTVFTYCQQRLAWPK